MGRRNSPGKRTFLFSTSQEQWGFPQGAGVLGQSRRKATRRERLMAGAAECWLPVRGWREESTSWETANSLGVTGG